MALGDGGRYLRLQGGIVLLCLSSVFTTDRQRRCLGFDNDGGGSEAAAVFSYLGDHERVSK